MAELSRSLTSDNKSYNTDMVLALIIYPPQVFIFLAVSFTCHIVISPSFSPIKSGSHDIAELEAHLGLNLSHHSCTVWVQVSL